ncbi:hypothetical protein, partial [Streptococcus pneumoniae]|uniref:hypothetical protein n=1 Tax=Streptococcus pneumoniae TaxID=1313 RepID=UPI00195464D0
TISIKTRVFRRAGTERASRIREFCKIVGQFRSFENFGSPAGLFGSANRYDRIVLQKEHSG